MESVAARAGVSKISLYRRWKGKAAMGADVLRRMGESSPLPDNGGLEEDLRSLVRATIGAPDRKAAAAMIMRTMGEIADDAALLAIYRKRILDPRLDQVRALVERAQARGQLRNDISVEVAASLVGGPLFLYYLAVLAGADRSVSPDFAESLVKSMVDALAPPGAGTGRARRPAVRRRS